MTKLCPACCSAKTSPFLCLEGLPVYSMALLDDRQSAVDCPRGDIDLGFCESCGFIFNRCFDPSLITYAPGYESSQACSPRFNAFAHELASRLAREYGLEGRRVLDIGCGNGDFLAVLCSLGVGEGIGIDPAAGEPIGPGAQGVKLVRELLEERHGAYGPALVCCRHTLEHIPDVRGFLATVRRAFGGDGRTPVFFELPDTERVLRDLAFWDIYYEHCSYFTADSLRRLFAAQGFSNIRTRYAFDGQYLSLEACANGGQSIVEPNGELEDVALLVDRFSRAWRQQMEERRTQVRRYAEEGRRCIVWGGGSKGVAFLNMLALDDEIDYVVDINPLKQQKYVAGTGHLIAGPGEVTLRPPDVVLLMNPVYTQEVTGMLGDRGVNARVVPV